ncbi:nucleotidyltransferase domain-containing protein [Methanomethylovorans sp.]|uniref:nucleotidyltransferase domain-containing protein n=1 Tax=Methanomethylovorans sp. TaxID=2758717 RepID=UPI00351C0FFB
MVKTSPLYEEQLQQIKSILLETFAKENVRIILVDLKKRGYSKNSMEIAIGFLPRSQCDSKKLIDSLERIEGIKFPFTVDLIDLSKVSESIIAHLLEDGEIWKDWK